MSNICDTCKHGPVGFCGNEDGPCALYSKTVNYKDEETTDGLKYDVDKVDFTFLQDWDLALAEICKLSEFGVKKYKRSGWTEIDDPERLKKAMLRHYFKDKPDAVDEDSGFMHDVAVAWNALGALQIRLQNM